MEDSSLKLFSWLNSLHLYLSGQQTEAKKISNLLQSINGVANLNPGHIALELNLFLTCVTLVSGKWPRPVVHGEAGLSGPGVAHELNPEQMMDKDYKFCWLITREILT